MSNWVTLKSNAGIKHAELLALSDGVPSAQALLDAAERLTGIKRQPCPAGDPLLAGADALLDLDVRCIWYDQDTEPGMAAFYQMHEYAHLWLHGKSTRCNKEDLDMEASEEELPLGPARVEAYSPRERVEREANVFAREVLLPSSMLRRWFLDENVSAKEIAARVGVPDAMVFHQLSYAILVSDMVEAPKEGKSAWERPALDKSQRKVAEWSGGPLLVEAGPGTGKTRALVGKIEFLLKKGVSPSSILALTFSNKAAEEMRSRIATAAPDEAPKIWMGTFHAFGLELLRKYGYMIGLPANFKVLDPINALFLLDRHLSSLDLSHYQNLYEPARYLPDILGAISRAKDELVGPEEYVALAERMRESAETEEETLAAEKAAEVARVYSFYQKCLEKQGLVDFGDLIFQSVVLMRACQDVKADIRKNYAHVLVDEYQDVNRASGIFLKEIVGDGSGLWVVGDTRQSIYRFRGASPANMRLFPQDFAGSEARPLEFNYRSLPAIVDVFSELAPSMMAARGQGFTPWKPKRNDQGGTVCMEVAEDLDSEADGIARKAIHLNDNGTAFREQAILCRSHTTMARFASRLEEAGVPVLYLGDLFEREEIRDLLSLISLACEGNGRGLVRVAGFPEYCIPLEDGVRLLKEAEARQVPLPKALEVVEELNAISAEGRTGLSVLRRHMIDISYGTSAWGMLVRYLFEQSDYLQFLLRDSSLPSRQKRLAIYQFVQFAHAQRGEISPEGEDPKRAFLRYVRNLEIYGEEKQLRQVPEWASGLNAVRLLTVHASKGLEFGAVFIPSLGQGYFPARNRWEPAPPPVGMIPADFLNASHDEEEECLFFVALSRARDFLCVSRAIRYGKQNSNASKFLQLIERRLPYDPRGKATWLSRRAGPVLSMAAPPTSPSVAYDVRDLDIYLRCPKKYFYERILGLIGKREDAAYVKFHQCVYKFLRWMATERSQGNLVQIEGSMAKLKEVWITSGPTEHPYEPIYLKNAQEMVSRAIECAGRLGQAIATP